MNNIRNTVFGYVLVMLTAGYPAAEVMAFYADQHHYSACMENVPLRRTPNMNSARIATIPRGTAVKVDKAQDQWIRVIYKVREGYYIGWSLAALLCPMHSQNNP